LFIVNVSADGTLAIDGEPVRLKNECEK
jgi:hypothetical protein